MKESWSIGGWSITGSGCTIAGLGSGLGLSVGSGATGLKLISPGLGIVIRSRRCGGEGFGIARSLGLGVELDEESEDQMCLKF